LTFDASKGLKSPAKYNLCVWPLNVRVIC
jgi:hypothetical protein